MTRPLTPERQKLKQEALSLRYDYGLSIRGIAGQLHVPKTDIDRWVSRYSNGTVSHNATTFVHLEGDCLVKLKDIPDSSVDCLLTDPPYSVMEDYAWDQKDDEFYHQWLALLRTKVKPRHSGFIFFDSRRSWEFEGILRDYFPLKNRIVWVRKNMSMGRVIKGTFISSYELVYYFGNRDLDLPKEWGAERFDSCEFAVPQSNFSDKKVHPTQKPINLILQLAEVGSRSGDVVLDCFAGSGVVGKACKFLGNRKCILIELAPEYNRLIKEVINGRYHEI